MVLPSRWAAQGRPPQASGGAQLTLSSSAVRVCARQKQLLKVSFSSLASFLQGILALRS